jgi:transposase
MIPRLRLLPIVVVLVLLPNLALAYQAKVVSVHDGDAITVLDDDEEQHKIRLASIDAPELRQPYGRAARQELADLVAGKLGELEPLVERCHPHTKVPPSDLRRMISTILWRHANGAKWRVIPAGLGFWWMVAQTFIRWSRLGQGYRRRRLKWCRSCQQ